MFITYPTFTVAIDDCFDTLIDLLPCPLSTPLDYDSTKHFAGCAGPLQLKVLRMAHKARRITTRAQRKQHGVMPILDPPPTQLPAFPMSILSMLLSHRLSHLLVLVMPTAVYHHLPPVLLLVCHSTSELQPSLVPILLTRVAPKQDG